MEREKVLFPNLEAELARITLSKSALSKIIGIASGSVYSKLSGKTEFNLAEMQAIRNVLNQMTEQHFTLDYLFLKRGEY